MSVHKPKICLACSAGGHLRELQLAIGDIPIIGIVIGSL
mgnify:CR=1 FL=1